VVLWWKKKRKGEDREGGGAGYEKSMEGRVWGEARRRGGREEGVRWKSGEEGEGGKNERMIFERVVEGGKLRGYGSEEKDEGRN